MLRRDKSSVTESALGVDAADGPGGRAMPKVRRPVVVSLLEVEPAIGGGLVHPPDPVLLRRGGGGGGRAAIARIMTTAPCPGAAPGHHGGDPRAWDGRPGNASMR
jgi:hypothetical protein